MLTSDTQHLAPYIVYMHSNLPSPDDNIYYVNYYVRVAYFLLSILPVI